MPTNVDALAASPVPSVGITERRFVSVEEYATSCGISTPTVRRMLRNGAIPFFQPGGRKARILIPVTALADMQRSASLDPTDRHAAPTSKTRLRH